MVFCNMVCENGEAPEAVVTILILIDGFLQYTTKVQSVAGSLVTILILIDGFLQ